MYVNGASLRNTQCSCTILDQTLRSTREETSTSFAGWMAEGQQCPDVVVVTEYKQWNHEIWWSNGDFEMKILISPSEMGIQLATTKKTLEMACESIWFAHDLASHGGSTPEGSIRLAVLLKIPRRASNVQGTWNQQPPASGSATSNIFRSGCGTWTWVWFTPNQKGHQISLNMMKQWMG